MKTLKNIHQRWHREEKLKREIEPLAHNRLTLLFTKTVVRQLGCSLERSEELLYLQELPQGSEKISSWYVQSDESDTNFSQSRSIHRLPLNRFFSTLRAFVKNQDRKVLAKGLSMVYVRRKIGDNLHVLMATLLAQSREKVAVAT